MIQFNGELCSKQGENWRNVRSGGADLIHHLKFHWSELCMGSEHLMTLRYHHSYGAHFPCGVTYDESKPLAHRFPHELQEPKFDRGDTDFTAGLNHQTFRTYPTTKLEGS